MFNRVKCCKCGKSLSRNKALAFTDGGPYYCPSCFEEDAIGRIAALSGKLNEIAAENKTLYKRTKNRGCKVFAILTSPRNGKPCVYTGTIYNRSKEECGVRFTDEAILEDYDCPEDFLTLYFPWEKIYLTETEAKIELLKEANKNADR